MSTAIKAIISAFLTLCFILSANAQESIFVSPNGSDANDCARWTPCLTLQHGYDEAVQSDDHRVNIYLLRGEYGQGLVAGSPLASDKEIAFVGDVTAPSNVTVSIQGNAFDLAGNQRLRVVGVRVQTTTGSAFAVSDRATLTLRHIEFGPVGESHIVSSTFGLVKVTGDYLIDGGGVSHLHAYQAGAIIIKNGTGHVEGAPDFTGYFAGVAANAQIIIGGFSYDGNATGLRFLSHYNGIINTTVPDREFLPGDRPGIANQGGLYLP